MTQQKRIFWKLYYGSIKLNQALNVTLDNLLSLEVPAVIKSTSTTARPIEPKYGPYKCTAKNFNPKRTRLFFTEA